MRLTGEQAGLVAAPAGAQAAPPLANPWRPRHAVHRSHRQTATLPAAEPRLALARAGSHAGSRRDHRPSGAPLPRRGPRPRPSRTRSSHPQARSVPAGQRSGTKGRSHHRARRLPTVPPSPVTTPLTVEATATHRHSMCLASPPHPGPARLGQGDQPAVRSSPARRCHRFAEAAQGWPPVDQPRPSARSRRLVGWQRPLVALPPR